jgi:hypothetical protein
MDAREVKRRFLQANNLDSIDESLHAYLSITTIKEIITEILGPVMVKAKDESEFIEKIYKEFNGLRDIMDAQSKEISSLKRGYKQFDEINRQ